MADKSLKLLGIRLAKADALLVEVLAYRMHVVRQIGSHKVRNGQKIIRPGIERQRISSARALAQQYGISGSFINAIWYTIIAEACRLQIVQVQGTKNACRPTKNNLQLRKLKKKSRKLVRQDRHGG